MKKEHLDFWHLAIKIKVFFLVVEINPQFYWGSGKTEQGYK